MSSASIPVSAPMTRAARPRTSSAGSGFFLLGMIELPVENASEARTNPNARVRPPRQLLREPAQVDHAERDRREDLDDEVAIADRVERVGGDAVEAELARGRLAIERIARAGQRARRRAGSRSGGAARRPAGPGRARPSRRRPAGDGRRGRAGPAGCGSCRAGSPSPSRSARSTRARSNASVRGIEPIDRPARPEPQVRGDLVVARAPGVQPAGDRPDPFGEGRLEVQMDVLERRVPRDPAGLDVLGERGRARRRARRPAPAVSSPARPRPRTWAIDPTRSSAASSRSMSIEPVNASTRASFASLNRPPQSRMLPPSRVAPC